MKKLDNKARILVMQTAYIGDAILATSLLEKLHAYYPQAQLDLLVRKGNESICKDHPFLHRVIVFDKSRKYINIWKLIAELRREKYDLVINIQRYFTTGLITVLSGGKETVGFNKNPLSFLFTHRIKHEVDIHKSGKTIHEIDRNQKLIACYTDEQSVKPKLYPKPTTLALKTPYICIAPFSVWFTKRYPEKYWVELIKLLAPKYTIYLMAGLSDAAGCERIIRMVESPNVESLAGKLNLLESAGVMKGAVMNFANDSGPLHLTSAVNAPVAALFCSTAKAYGFTPLSDHAIVFETKEYLACKPCGLHGRNACPMGHFKCSEISPLRIVETLKLL
ncbi:MAG: glycosyltransferase family 9 protein [Cytophagaceae bacterium]|nr:glycosyltransferase family 9 protein [Cytophagaceae bacterium]